jgi:NAD(P)-dependent dehydrogenase (short-subunit alcohol dehydrogenase family)
MRLQGKKAIVTGAAQGLGAAIVERLAKEGCDVAGWDVAADKIRETAEAVAKSTGRKVLGRAVDVTDDKAVRNAIDGDVAALGGLDICVANAGILFSGDSVEFDIAKWRRVIEVNLVGYFVCAREAARAMLAHGHLKRETRQLQGLAIAVGRTEVQSQEMLDALPKAACIGSKAAMVAVASEQALHVLEQFSIHRVSRSRTGANRAQPVRRM